MSKICQRYFSLLFIGLLPLIPFAAGCSCNLFGPPTPTESTPVPVFDDLADPVDPEPALEKPEPERFQPAMPSEGVFIGGTSDSPVVPGEMVVLPSSEQIPVPVLAEPPAAHVEPETIEPITIPAPETVEPAEKPSTPGVHTESPVDQISPVNQTSPVNTESPVREGNFSLSLAGRKPMMVLVSQVDQSEQPSVVPESETVLKPETVPESETEFADVDVTNQDAEDVPPPVARQRGQRGERGEQQFQRGERNGEQFQRGEPRGGIPPMGPPGVQGPSGQGRPVTSPPPSVVREPRLEPAEGLRFNFRFAPWRDVIEWFADQAAMSLQANRIPTGTLNLVDGQLYTPTEALDILNSFLLWQDYSLLRRGRVLFVVYLPDGIPPNLLEPITPEELDERGRYEITRCVFNLNRTTPDIIEAEIRGYLGPQGSSVILPRSQQIVVTETGGTLRTIRDMIRRIDDPDGVSSIGTIHTVELRNVAGEEALQIMRALLAIDANDASLRTVADSSGKKVYISGRGDMVERAREVLMRIDSDRDSNDPRMRGEPQFNVYDTGSADPATVLAVLQTLLAGMPDVRLSLDPRTNGISVLARPASHATVREAIKQMQLNVPQVAIIPLKRMSPQTAVDTIKRFYQTWSPLTATTTTGGRDGGGGGQRQQTAATSQPPTVEPDLTARQIIVRGTITQITEIKSLLASLGEDGVAGSTTNVATTRVIPLSPTATSLVLEQLRDILPTLDPNINLIAPQTRTEPEAIPVFTTPEIPDVDSLIDETFDKEIQDFLDFMPLQTTPPMTRLMRVAGQPVLAQVASFGEPQNSQPNITVTLTPAGFVLSGNDPETLDKVEALIRMLSDESVLGRIELQKYELQHSTASVTSSTLQTLMGTTTPGLGASGIASVDLPEWQNAELMGLVGTQGSSIEKTGTVTITVDERLNSLLIQANPVDHKTIKGLLLILDQPDRDDIMNRATPRFLPLTYMRAEEAKTAVEQAFAAKMQGNRAGGQQAGGAIQQQGRGQQAQLPGAAMMMQGPGGQQGMEALQRVMAAMQQGGGRGQQTPREQEPPMTLSVLDPGNSLVVSSTKATFLEVKAFVEALEEAASQRTIVMVQEQLRYTTPAFAQQTLGNLLGSAARITTNQQAAQQQIRGGTFGNTGTFGTGAFGGMGGTFGGGTMGGAQTRPGGTFGGGTTVSPMNMMGIGGAQQRTGGTSGGGAASGGTQQRTGSTFGGGR